MFLLYGAPLPLSLLEVEQESDDVTGREAAAAEIFQDSVWSPPGGSTTSPLEDPDVGAAHLNTPVTGPCKVGTVIEVRCYLALWLWGHCLISFFLVTEETNLLSRTFMWNFFSVKFQPLSSIFKPDQQSDFVQVTSSLSFSLCEMGFDLEYGFWSSFLSFFLFSICAAEVSTWSSFWFDLLDVFYSFQFSCSVVSDSATPWTAARQASLSITNSQSLLKLMSIKSVMPSSHLILRCLLLLPPSLFPSIRVFSNESALQ